MSVSYLQQPDEYMSGFDPNYFVVSSSAAHQTNFQFRVRVCDSGGNVLREFYNDKDPEYGTLYFDPHRTIENYLSYDSANLIAGTTGWQTGVNTFMEYYINVAEMYGTAGALSIFASSNSNVIKAINAAEDYENWSENSINNNRVVFLGTNDARFLTNQPSSIPIRIDDSYELGIITDTGSIQGIHLIKIKTYNSAGTLLKTATLNNPYGTLSSTARSFLSILVGPEDINNTTLTTGTQPIVESGTAYYDVFIEDSFGTVKTETKRFTLDTSCTRTGTYNRLFWLNPLGRFDGFNFTQVGEDNIDVNQSYYKRLKGVKTQSTFTFPKYQVESSSFHSEIKQGYKLRSGFLSEDEALWLKELVASPLVYMLVEGNFRPVVIKTVNYTAKGSTQKLFSMELDVELSVTNQRQRL